MALQPAACSGRRVRREKMRRFILGTAGLALLATAAFATDDPVATRKKLMDANGAAAGLAFGMLKGEIPFDAKAAQSTLQTFNSVGWAYGDYFPPGSDKGDTRASPKIWEDMAGFQKQLADFRERSEAAVAAKPQDLDAYRALVGPIGEVCESCHEDYRLSRN
jgi:cytochrome c556